MLCREKATILSCLTSDSDITKTTKWSTMCGKTSHWYEWTGCYIFIENVLHFLRWFVTSFVSQAFNDVMISYASQKNQSRTSSWYKGWVGLSHTVRLIRLEIISMFSPSALVMIFFSFHTTLSSVSLAPCYHRSPCFISVCVEYFMIAVLNRPPALDLVIKSPRKPG